MSSMKELDEQRALISSMQRIQTSNPQWDDEQRRTLNGRRLELLENSAVRLLAELGRVDEGLSRASSLLKRDIGR